MRTAQKSLFTLNLTRKGMILVAVPLLLELSFILVLSLTLAQSEQSAARESHGKEVVARVDYIGLLTRTITGFTTFYQETSSSESRTYYKNGVLKTFPVIHSELQALKTIVQKSLRQEQVFSNIELLTRTLEQAAEYILNHDQLPAAVRSKIQQRASVIMCQINTELQQLVALEAISDTRKFGENARGREQVKQVIFGGVTLDVLVTITLAIFFMTGIVNRLKVMTANTSKLEAGEPLNPPIGGQDEIATLDSTFHQMAEALVEAMRKERAVIENTVDVICTIAEDGTITKINHAAQINWGYDPQALIGASYKQIIASDDLSKTERSFDELLKAKSVGSFENKINGKDGTLKDVLWSVHYVEGERAFFCVVHDITERKELERLKQDFVAMVSHDLRTPLTSLQGGLALLSTGKFGELNDRGTQLLEGGERSIDRLVRLINDLLDIEKLEAGKFDMVMKLAKLSDVFDRALTDVKSLADKGSVSLQASDQGLEVYADRERLVQVLVNLIGNAIKFSPAGGDIKISAHESDGWTVIKVRDQGPGIPAAYKDAVFDRYRQLPGGQAKKGSTGLGLAICKVIVEQHGGTIGVDSEEGKGSTFWFRLPSGNPLPE
jgi:PAS domain S-box-containing protein